MNKLQYLIKVLFSIFIMLFTFGSITSFAQEKQARKTLINEYKIDKDYRLIVYYLNVENNILHPNSAHYLRAQPTAKEWEHALWNLPSYSIILVNDERMMMANFNLLATDDKQFQIQVQEYESTKDYFIDKKYDAVPEARFEEIKQFYTNEKDIKLKNLPLDKVLDDIEQIIKDNRLYALEVSNLYFPTQQDIGNYIYEKSLENKEFIDAYQQVEDKAALLDSEDFQEFLMTWGNLAYQAGLDKEEDMLNIFKSAYPEVEMNGKIIKYLVKGFRDLP